MSRLAAHGLTLGYGGAAPVVEGLDLEVLDGVVTVVIGANGCGKSTLLRALGRLMRPKEGQVLLDGKRINQLKTKEVARLLGMLPQSPLAPEGLTVGDLVARGRQPHQSWFSQWSAEDESVAAEVMAWTGMLEHATRPVDELSGGQRQRAWISMALAQDTGLLLLDEPTNHLDLAHAVEVLDLVDRLHDELGRTVVMVLHDLNLAARYADHLVAMKDGRIIAQGTPVEVLTVELLAEAFGLRAQVIADPVSDRVLVVPIGSRHVTL